MSRLTLTRRLLSYAKPMAGWLILSALMRVCTQVAACLLLLIPVLKLTGTLALSLAELALALTATAIIAGVTRYLEQFLGHRCAFSLLASLRVDLYAALARQDLEQTQVDGGTVLNVATEDIDRIEVFYAHTLAPAATAVLVPGALVGISGWLFGAGPASVIALTCALAWGIALSSMPADAHAQSRLVGVRAEISSHLAQDGRGRAELKNMGAEPARLRTLIGLESELDRTVMWLATGQGWRQAYAFVWPWVVIALVVWWAGPSDLAAGLGVSIGVLTAASALKSVDAFCASAPAAAASARRYFALVDAAPAAGEAQSSPGALPEAGGTVDMSKQGAGPVVLGSQSSTAAGLELCDVSLNRPGADARLASNINLRVPAGARVGIVGESGCGKSTLLSLLMRVRDPICGDILIDGVNVRDLSPAQVRAHVTLVGQTPFALTGSVWANLRIGNPDLTPDEAWTALDMAQLSEHVSSLAAGLDTLVVVRGRPAMSGGQLQRLNVARAFARQPRILLLDESTSQQDPLTQAALDAVLTQLPDTTIISVAHRQLERDFPGPVYRLSATGLHLVAAGSDATPKARSDSSAKDIG